MDKYYQKGREVLKTLLDNNYQAYFVGGFVRDHLLGIKINDIDITTDALPDVVLSLFEKAKATGKRYGTVSVFKGAHTFEVTTFRAEREYLDHRRPKVVEFSKDIKEDLIRRDFTINAFAMDYEGKILDLFNGKQDLENKLIKAIGNPNERFNEDALRILRAFRFVAKLDFDVEENTFKSIKENILLLKEISNERILMELRKICAYPYSKKALKLLYEAKFYQAFPEFKEALELLYKTENFEISYIELFALSLRLNNQALKNYWKFSKKEKAIIEKIVELSHVTENDSFNEMIIYRLGRDIPWMANSINQLINPKNNQEDLINNIYNNLPIYRTCDLVFKGQDILELTTLRNAEIIGDIIDDLTYQVITNNLANDYDELKAYTLKLMEKQYGIK